MKINTRDGIEDNDILVEQGKKLTSMLSIGGIICSFATAFLIQRFNSVVLTVVFFLLLYKGYGWVRYYFIAASVLSNIGILVILIPYYSVLSLIPNRYLIALMILFIQGIVLVAVLGSSRGVKSYMLYEKSKRIESKRRTEF